MTSRGIILALAVGLAAGCGTPPDAPPPPLQSSYTGNGEAKIGRYFFNTNDKITKRDTNVYRVLLSNTWIARRGDKLNDSFCRLAFPATAPTDDYAMAALLDEFAKHGFYNLPGRQDVRADDILIPGRNVDALVVETDRVRKIVFQRDLASNTQRMNYFQCLKVFEQLAEANRPAVIGVGVEKKNSYLDKLLKQPPRDPVEEPKPTHELKPLTFTPEARRQMEEEERREQERKKSPPPGPSNPPPGPGAGGGAAPAPN
jgi:hypothetical protein